MTDTPKYRNTGQGSFWGSFLFDLVMPKDHSLLALKELFDWEELGARLIGLYEG